MNKKTFMIGFILFFIGYAVSAQNNGIKTIYASNYQVIGDGKTLNTKQIYKILQESFRHDSVRVKFPKGDFLTELIDINPKKPIYLIIEGDGGETTFSKYEKDSNNIALFFSEAINVKYLFKNIQLDGNYLKRERKWKTVSKDIIDVVQPTSGILIWNAKEVTFDNVKVKNFHGNGLAANSTSKVIAKECSVINTSLSGILAHRVQDFIVSNSYFENNGIITPTFILNEKSTSNYKQYRTQKGDGVSGYCDKFIAIENEIHNPGRIGITHDLAIDLGYKNSSALISKNSLFINSDMINNSNPPCPMWFEQSHDLTIKDNNIKIIKTNTPYPTAIRFYQVSGKVICNNNFIDASNYNNILNEVVGVFEPLSSNYDIKNNNAIGKFKSFMTISYGQNKANVKALNLSENKIKAQPNNVIFLSISVSDQLNMPQNIEITNNHTNLKNANLTNFRYYGSKARTKKINITNLKMSNNN